MKRTTTKTKDDDELVEWCRSECSRTAAAERTRGDCGGNDGTSQCRKSLAELPNEFCTEDETYRLGYRMGLRRMAKVSTAMLIEKMQKMLVATGGKEDEAAKAVSGGVLDEFFDRGTKSSRRKKRRRCSTRSSMLRTLQIKMRHRTTRKVNLRCQNARQSRKIQRTCLGWSKRKKRTQTTNKRKRTMMAAAAAVVER